MMNFHGWKIRAVAVEAVGQNKAGDAR